MIEAVNSVLANAQVLRGNAEQMAASRSFAANPDRVQEISVPKAPFISPYISVDVNYNKAVLQIRDSETGDVLNQFPSESRLQQQQTAGQTQQQGGEVSRGRDNGTSASAASGRSEAGVAAPQNEVGYPDIAQVQMASAALSAGAQTAVQNISAGVNVQA